MTGNTFGRVFRVTTCGESYGGALGIIVDGVPPGLELSEADIQPDLDRRRPGTSAIESPRGEVDRVEVFAGVQGGYTTGAPVGLLIRNVDRQQMHVDQYAEVKHLVRPGHAEYPYFVKYGRFTDWCGAGRASGRETAGRVAAGAIARKLLAREGVDVIAYVTEVAGIKARPMSFEEAKAKRDQNEIRCPDAEAAARMIERVLEIKAEGDTAGGIVEGIARGVPPGLGEPVYDKIDADLAQALISIPAVKGIEFGAGFAAKDMKGSEHNDIPYIEGDRVRHRTNHAGGMLGGITTGEDLVLRVVVKPTCTISIEQDTVHLWDWEPAKFRATTRRDAQICSRAAPVVEAMMAIVILDHLTIWRGTKHLARPEATNVAEGTREYFELLDQACPDTEWHR